jgi:predicted MPP superfamily phosphohydrolase
MRSFQLLYLFIFVVFWFFIGLGAYSSLREIIQREKFKIGFWGYSIFFIFIFIFLYIYPYQPSEAKNYLIYFYFNALLFIDFIVKIILSVFFIFGLFFKQKRIVSFAGIIVASGLGLGILYGLSGGRNNIKITRLELYFDSLPESFNNFKIVHVSDIHLGSISQSNSLLPEMEEKINAIDPDLLLFTGDLVNNFSDETEGWSELFNRITSHSESISILGNHDYGDYAEWDKESDKTKNFAEIVQAHSKLGFTLLQNEYKIIHRENDSVFIVGVENWGLPPFPQYANLEKASKGIPGSAFKILLTHDPAHWDSVVKKEKKYQLTLSGHTHGMQWGIKFAGIPLSLAYLTRPTWGGLYRDENTFLYVNTGIGTVGIPWRIDMPAEITVFTLKRAKINRE